MKKLLFAVLFLPSLAWSAYQPMTGSTVTIFTTGFGNLPTSVNNTPSVINQVANVNGSSVTVGYQANMGSVPVQVQNTVTITGSISNTGFNVNNTPSVVGSLSDNGAASTNNRIGNLPGIYLSSTSINSTATTGRDAALTVGVFDGAARVAQTFDLSHYSYSASTNGFSLASSATDVTGLCGNASNGVAVKGLYVQCIETTAGIVQGSVRRYSTRFSGVWSTMTAVSDYPNQYSLVQSTAVYFTANPTVGTQVGDVDNVYFGAMAAATASPNDFYIQPPGWALKPPVLNGTAQCLTFNLESQTLSGGKCSVRWNWIEDPLIK